MSGLEFSVRSGVGTPPRVVPDEVTAHVTVVHAFGSGVTCWRRLRDWNEAGVCQRVYEVLLAEHNSASRLDWSRCVVDRRRRKPCSHAKLRSTTQR